MAPTKTKLENIVYRVVVEGEYYANIPGGKAKERYKEEVLLPHGVKEFGYRYAIRSYLTEKFKAENLSFRSLRTWIIRSTTIEGNPDLPVEEMDLMGYAQLIQYVKKHYPQIRTDLYYSRKHADELIQAVLNFESDPTSALAHQEWKLKKAANGINLHNLMTSVNGADETAL